MASTAAKVRYVRCPKCHKLLIEFADVPVYQCGGCGTLLRAKYSNPAGDEGTLSTLDTSNSQNQPGNGSSDNSPTSSGNPCSSANSSEAGHGGNNITVPNLCSSLNAEHNSHQKGEPSETGENGIKEESSNTDQHSFRFNLEYTAESQPNESIQTKTDFWFNEDGDKSQTLSQQDPDGLASSYKLEEFPESSSHYVAIEEDLVDRSRDYDGSVSSPNDGPNGCVHGKHLHSSTITSRDELVSGSVDSKENEGGDALETDEMNGSLMPEFQDLSLKSSSERRMHRFDSSRGESSSMYRVRTQERGASLDSVEFHSAKNWMGSEGDWHSRTLSRDSAFHGDSLNRENISASTKFKHHELDRIELLRMVSGLRDQVSELYDRREGKSRSHIRRTPHMHPSFFNRNSGQHLPLFLNSNSVQRPHGTYYGRYQVSQMPLSGHSCYSCSQLLLNFRHSGPCRACRYNMWCLPSEAADHPLHSSSEKSLHKERRQPSKRHCLPLYGAAPFVICYKCLKLLQLPADFLMSRRKLQKLQCGACSEVLLLPSRSSVRYTTPTSIEVLHDPSEVDDGADAATEPNKEDTISLSDEYGMLFSKSYSTEAEGVLSDPRSSCEGIIGKQAAGNTLLRLMGYSSATEILYQPSEDDGGYENTDPTRPHSRRASEESHVSRD